MHMYATISHECELFCIKDKKTLLNRKILSNVINVNVLSNVNFTISKENSLVSNNLT